MDTAIHAIYVDFFTDDARFIFEMFVFNIQSI